MATAKPTIVLVTTHTALSAVYERHLERFAKVVLMPEVAEFERRALRLHASLLVIDTGSVGVDDDVVAHVRALHKQPTMKSLHIVVFAKKASSDFVAALHHAGADDIILTTHTTPRSVAERLHNLILL